MENAINRVKLTPEQKQQWEDTKMLMGWKCPGFQHLMYKLLANNDGEYVAVMSDSVPVAATDAKNIIVNPNTFFDNKRYNLMNRVFITAHEVIHVMCRDVELLHQVSKLGKVPMNDGTFLPFDNETMQISMDQRNNAILKRSNIGKMPQDAVYDESVTGEESVLDLYKKNYVDKPEGDGDGEGEGDGKGKGKGKGGKPERGKGGKGAGFDDILAPGTSTGQDPNTAAAERNDQQWAVEIAAAEIIETSKAQGRMAGALSRMFKQLLEPEIPWTEHIRGELAKRLGGGGYNWKEPDRRAISRDLYAPKRSGNGAGWIICGCDCSGSIYARVQEYLHEISGIIEDVKPRRLTVVWWDDGICQVDELGDSEDLQNLVRNGVKNAGGGTRIEPMYKWIEENSNGETPDMCLVFTDGYFTFPRQAPNFQQIWVSLTDVEYPWGDVVRIKGKNR